jgi:hypothetical protein
MKNEIIMKTIKYAISIFIMLGIMISCSESNLDLEPIGDTEADIFDKEIDFEHALLGTYSKIMDYYIYGSAGGDWEPMHEFWLLPGDDLTSFGNYSFEVFSTLEPGNKWVNRYFQLTYQLVNRTNTNLEKIAEDEESEESAYSNPATRNYHKGENLFLRGLANYNLWNYYGTAPVILERINTADKINPESSDGIQLLNQAIEDFTAAADLLPDSWDASNRGRATKSSANGYLGKSLVIKASWVGDNGLYSQADAAFQKITDKSLMANYNDNFSAFNENNDESLFEAQAGECSPLEDNIWLWNDEFDVVGSFSAYYGYFDGHWSLWAGTPYLATDKLVNAIDPADPRLPYIVDPATNMIQKYLVENEWSPTNGASSLNNPRSLRYADILLLQAEALNETGNQNGAIALINQVRTRARNMVGGGTVPADHPSGASQDQVRQWIMDERFVELAAEEGHRWLDLRRWHNAGHIDLSNWDFDSAIGSFNIDLPKHLLWPIPSGEVDLNKNIIQNDGY